MILQREENNRKLEHHLNNLMKYAGQDKFTLKYQNIPTSFPCSAVLPSPVLLILENPTYTFEARLGFPIRVGIVEARI